MVGDLEELEHHAEELVPGNSWPLHVVRLTRLDLWVDRVVDGSE